MSNDMWKVSPLSSASNKQWEEVFKLPLAAMLQQSPLDLMPPNSTGLHMLPEAKAVWLTALRSGRYRQVFGVLHGPNGGHCVLGLLQQITGVSERTDAERLGRGSWLGLFGLTEERSSATDAVEDIQTILTAGNDNRLSFGQLAGWIEKNL